MRLPPLNSLRAFAAVASGRSLQRAADELSVTPQAVGQQIKKLEAWLQLDLFERRGRIMEPTRAGLQLSHFVNSGFEEMAEGIRRVTRSSERDRINLNASPYFATFYLLPCLSLIRDVLPTTDIRLSTKVYMPEFMRDEIDIAIQWGYGDWPGMDAHLLIADPKIICCTPEIAVSIHSKDDLARVPLLDAFTSMRLWPDIFRFLGVDEPVAPRKIGFDDAATMRRAALEGIGVGLIAEIYADEDLRSGQLVAPLGRDVLARMPPSDIPGFYLVAPRASLRVKVVSVLYRWLQQQDWLARAGVI